ncbi:MAG: SPFH domain-containing protein [Clostridia bacterium]|nr:SPFH domain-containing protein [Clostridia bacterium]
MGIIKATFNALGGSLADSWLEVIEADAMSDTTVLTKGVKVRKNDRRNNNRRGTEDYISNGSIIHVGEGQCMLLVDGGKVVDFSAEAGYYKVDNSTAPSLFAGDWGKAFVEAFARIKYSGVAPTKQKALYINMQEIKGLRFGTKAPVNYFDKFYNSELFLRAHGTYSVKITNPLLFYIEAIPKDRDRVDMNDINLQYLSEFLEALQAALNQMSVDGIRISHVASKSRELSKYMAEELDEDWNRTRGMEIQAVGIASISYDEESQKLINMRNQGAMLGDPTVREGYMQGAMARGFEAAGSNSAGTAATFMGMGVGMGVGGNMFAAASAGNQAQIERQQAERKAAEAAAAQKNAWKCACGTENTGKFCVECGQPRPAPAGEWTCACGAKNSGKFCTECGKPRPASDKWTCACGAENTGKFCTECGKARP